MATSLLLFWNTLVTESPEWYLIVASPLDCDEVRGKGPVQHRLCKDLPSIL